MFWTNKQKGVEKKISQMNNLLARSFANVKNDTQNIFQWLNFLYQRNLAQDNKIKDLQELLGHANLATTQRYTKVSREQLKKVRSPLDDL